jgi:hypothetical protein
MAMEHTRSTAATRSSSHNGSYSATLSASTILPANTSPSIAYDQRQFIESLALPIALEKKQMLLLGTMHTTVVIEADVTMLIEACKTLSPPTGTNHAAEHPITTFPYCYSETIQETIRIMSGYLKKDW